MEVLRSSLSPVYDWSLPGKNRQQGYDHNEQKINAELNTDLAQRVANKIIDHMYQNYETLGNISVSPSDFCKESFSFNIQKGLCTQLIESLDENSIIADWLKEIKRQQIEENERVNQRRIHEMFSTSVKKAGDDIIREYCEKNIRFLAGQIDLTPPSEHKDAYQQDYKDMVMKGHQETKKVILIEDNLQKVSEKILDINPNTIDYWNNYSHWNGLLAKIGLAVQKYLKIEFEKIENSLEQQTYQPRFEVEWKDWKRSSSLMDGYNELNVSYTLLHPYNS